MNRSLKCIIIGSLFLAGTSHAKYLFPPVAESLVRITDISRQPTLNPEFKILVWNIYKGKNQSEVQQDLLRFSRSYDLFLLQEGMLDDELTPFMKRDLANIEFYLAKSFVYEENNFASGVITGSKPRPSSVLMQRTTGVEPFVKTPKTTILSNFLLANGKVLTVANIHGINRAKNEVFFAQIDQVISVLKKNPTGPLIFAGDFNTNKKGKMEYLLSELGKLGMKLVPLPNDNRRSKLDWIFVRGCEVKKAEILFNVESSDHFPLSADLNCL